MAAAPKAEKPAVKPTEPAAPTGYVGEPHPLLAQAAAKK